MAALLSFLLNPRVPLWQYCMAALPIALVPTAALIAAAYGTLVFVGADVSSIESRAEAYTVGRLLGAVLFAPIAETLLLGMGLQILLTFTSRTVVVLTASAIAWGALHAVSAPFWFFGTVWSFFIYSAAYLGWQKRSLRQAFIAAAVPHALINLLATAHHVIANAA